MSISRKIALFDLDGTLVDYHKTLNHDLLKLESLNEKQYDLKIWHHEGIPAYLEERKRLITSQPGWWENLPKYEPGWTLLEMCKEIGFKIMILTKGPDNRENAWTEKVKWCKKHLPDKNITITTDKSVVYGRVLVDDYAEYVYGWLSFRPRGLAIMPTPANLESILPDPRIIVYQPYIGLETYIMQKLKESYDRE